MKLKISKVLDVSKFLPTEAGNQLKDLIIYIGEFTQQVVQALNGKLSFTDNFVSEIKTLNILSNKLTVVDVNGRRVNNVFVIRVIDSTYFVVDRFGWKYGNDGNLNVVIGLLGDPEEPKQVEILILY